MISFGAWLRQQRRSRDLTQVELAKLVGCAVGTLRNIETGDARPSKQLAALLAATFGVADEDVAALVAVARRNGKPHVDELSALSGAASVPTQAAPLQLRRVNLPAQLTGLIGRTHEVDAICALLLRPDVRLVTLTGPGGTGKTRVAVQVANQVLDAFPNGVVFVDLAALNDPDLVLATIAQTLGVTEGGEQGFSKQLAATLRDQSLLLLLDNFEQVIDAAPAVSGLLTACPKLKMLITSRITPDIAGEFEWPVPPLALPDRSPLPPIEQLTEYESVRLFSERARAVNPQFTVTPSNAPAVAAICHRLDGLPLAIELAAARVRLLQPQALLTRLDHRLTLLTGGGRDRPTRQQTMSNTIAWSYQLLSPNEQGLFRQLGIFVGDATLAAITAVCGDGETEAELVALVAALVNHSLLRRLPPAFDTADTVDVEPRFGMLETIREYALEQLVASGEADASRRRHANYYLALAEAAAAQWDTSTVAAAIAQFKREHDNMRAVLQWAKNAEPLLGLQLAGALSKFWKRCGYWSEGRAWLAELLALNNDLRNTDTLAMRLRAVEGAAWLASDQHDFVQATQLFEQSKTLRQALGEAEDETALLISTAIEARAVGQYKQATALLEDALAWHRALGNRGSLSASGLGLSLYMLGLVLREQGDFRRAEELFDACIELHRSLGDREGFAFGLLALSDIARDQGNSAQVRAYCEESIAILQAVGVQTGIGFALNNLALAAYLEGDLPRARVLIDESQSVFRAQKADGGLAEVLITLGQIAQAQGDMVAAHAALTESLRLTSVVGPQLVMAVALEALASVSTQAGQTVTAVQFLSGAATLREQMGTPLRPIDQSVMTNTLATVRSTLGEDVFAATWSESKNLPLEQLLNSVLTT